MLLDGRRMEMGLRLGAEWRGSPGTRCHICTRRGRGRFPSTWGGGEGGGGSLSFPEGWGNFCCFGACGWVKPRCPPWYLWAPADPPEKLCEMGLPFKIGCLGGLHGREKWEGGLELLAELKGTGGPRERDLGLGMGTQLLRSGQVEA